MERYTEGKLYYDRNQERWCINGYELHCGDCFEVRRHGKWKPVWIDYNQLTKKFYTTPHIQLERDINVRYKLY